MEPCLSPLTESTYPDSVRFFSSLMYDSKTLPICSPLCRTGVSSLFRRWNLKEMLLKFCLPSGTGVLLCKIISKRILFLESTDREHIVGLLCPLFKGCCAMEVPKRTPMMHPQVMIMQHHLKDPFMRRRREDTFVHAGTRREPRSNGALRSGAPQKTLPIETLILSMVELNKMTHNFGSSALIGEDSYGQVLYGKLSNGQEAAVKKLDTNSSPEPDSDFIDQLPVVSRLKNDYFVELLGGKQPNLGISIFNHGFFT